MGRSPRLKGHENSWTRQVIWLEAINFNIPQIVLVFVYGFFCISIILGHISNRLLFFLASVQC